MKLPRKTFRFMLFATLIGCLLDSLPAWADDSTAEVKPRDLGPPLVDNIKELKQLGKYAGWVDLKDKQVVLVGETCKAGYGLEFLVTSKERAYESVIVIDGRRHDKNEMSVFQLIHASLLAVGANSWPPRLLQG